MNVARRLHLVRAKGITGERGKLSFHAWPKESSVEKGICHTCAGPVRKSWRTGILHRDCFGCRYLKMIYGPNIKVERTE